MYRLQGKRFEAMAQDDQCPFRQICHMRTEYNVYIQRKGYHWFLLVKCPQYIPTEDTEEFVTLEITTPNLRDFCRVMDVLKDDEGKELVDHYEGTFLDLCKMADKVVDDMDIYSLFSNNCQHFCNNLLKRLKMKTYPPTVGPETTVAAEERPFDRFDYLVDHMNSRVASALAQFINRALRVPPTTADRLKVARSSEF